MIYLAKDDGIAPWKRGKKKTAEPKPPRWSGAAVLLRTVVMNRLRSETALRHACRGSTTNTPEAVVNERDAITLLKETALAMQQQIVGQKLVQVSMAAMICALISTHGDKAVVHQEFGRFWTAIGGPKHAVEEMLRGGGEVAAFLRAFSTALGMALP